MLREREREGGVVDPGVRKNLASRLLKQEGGGMRGSCRKSTKLCVQSLLPLVFYCDECIVKSRTIVVQKQEDPVSSCIDMGSDPCILQLQPRLAGRGGRRW